MPIMLLRTDRWVADPHVPDEVVGRSFMLLTDAMPVRMDASHTTRDSFRQDVATTLRADLAALAIQPSLPNIGDFEALGRQCRSVLVATERLPTIPVPPGLPRVPRHICFVDQRPLLRGIRWVFAERGRLSLAELLRPLEPFIPDGHTINVLGGSREHGWDGTWLEIWPGCGPSLSCLHACHRQGLFSFHRRARKVPVPCLTLDNATEGLPI